MSFPESKGGMHRFGLTHNLEPASEHKMFHSTETVNGLSLWNTDTKHGITLLMELSSILYSYTIKVNSNAGKSK